MSVMGKESDLQAYAPDPAVCLVCSLNAAEKQKETERGQMVTNVDIVVEGERERERES